MKASFLILSVCISTFSCTNNAKSVEIKKHQDNLPDTLTTTQSQGTPPHIDLIWEIENLKLYGDTTIEEGKIFYASIKFEPFVGFEDFKVSDVDHNVYAPLKLSSHKSGNNFRTRLKDGYNSNMANFAGHYSFVYWGCGSSCQSSLLIDRKTGRIYDAPGASLGYDFRIDSKMLIVNPPDSSGFYDNCFYCKPIIYIFDEQSKEFVERHAR